MHDGALRWPVRWAALALVLHALWEISQLPLYALWEEADGWRIMAYVAHCIAGDVLIALLTFLLVAAALRRFDWPRARPWVGGTCLTVVGLAYTAFSEWYNVYAAGAWSYAAQMPLVLGIGLTPMLQWLILPALMVVVAQRWR